MAAFEDKCPVCGSDFYDVDNVDVIDDVKLEKCYCDLCDATWTQKWVFVELEDVESYD